MGKIIRAPRTFLEKIDYKRDQLLFLFIKPYWPRKFIPNQITMIRIVIGMILFTLLFVYKVEDRFLITILFTIGVVTDLFDGSVARCLNKVTELGKQLDPIADRVLIIPIAVYSLLDSHKWLLLSLVVVEIINAVVSVYYNKEKEIKEGANIYGKTKMVLQSIVFIAILIVWPETPPLLFIYLLWLTILISLTSVASRILQEHPKKAKI